MLQVQKTTRARTRAEAGVTSCRRESDQPGCASLGLLEGEEGLLNLRRARRSLPGAWRPHCCPSSTLQQRGQCTREEGNANPIKPPKTETKSLL